MVGEEQIRRSGEKEKGSKPDVQHLSGFAAVDQVGEGVAVAVAKPVAMEMTVKRREEREKGNQKSARRTWCPCIHLAWAMTGAIELKLTPRILATCWISELALERRLPWFWTGDWAGVCMFESCTSTSGSDGRDGARPRSCVGAVPTAYWFVHDARQIGRAHV